ncbi:hypothetical protein ABZP36_009201 [Zizania latifolia]
MGKKGGSGLTSIFSRLVVAAGSSAAGAGASPTAPSPPWQWPPCVNNPQTVSFRHDDGNDCPCSTTTAAACVRGSPAAAARPRNRKAGEMYKTVNSVYFDYFAADDYGFEFDDEEEDEEERLPDGDDSFSTTTASEEWSEAVIRSLGRTSTDRFFFDPGPPTNSILATAASEVKVVASPAAAAAEQVLSTSASHDDKGRDVDVDEKQLPAPPPSLVEESVAVAVDSEDPYRDFRSSMEEMVAAHGLRGWDSLEELLVWYLRVNSKHNHALIVGAFVDLLISLAAAAATTTSTTTTTSSSRSTASTSTACDVTTTTTTSAATLMEQCGGRSKDPSCSCSSAASSHDLEEEEENELPSEDLSSITPPTTLAS